MLPKIRRILLALTTTILAWAALSISCEQLASAALPVTFDGQWHWTDMPGTICLDGSATGIAVNAVSSNAKLLIYMEGGGFCTNKATCQTFASGGAVRSVSFGQGDFDYWWTTGLGAFTNINAKAGAPQWAQPTGARGIFDRSNPANPFQHYNYVYIPYCSGDLHQGARQDTTSLNPLRVPSQSYHFGYTNFGILAGQVQQTFPAPPAIVLTGESAGGFGAYYNFGQLRALYSILIRITVIDDSGVPFWTGDEGWFPRRGYLMFPGTNPNVPSYIEDWMADAWGLDFTHPLAVLPVTRLQAYRPIYPQQSVFNWFVNTNLGDTFGVLTANDDALITANFNFVDPPGHPSVQDGFADFQLFAATGKINVRTFAVTSTGQRDTSSLPWNRNHTFLSDDIASLQANGVLNWLTTQFNL
jgi:hypothetical protein